MVNYAEEADFVGRRKKKRLNPREIQERKEARAAKRSEDEWRSYARDLCYRQLGMMERSVHQLRESMSKNLVPDAIADETIDVFVSAGLVSDERFAQMFVRSKFVEKTTSRRAIRRDLERKGISAQTAEAALSQITEDDETQAAIEYVQRKSRSLATVEPEVARRRLYGQLARRGFSPDQIRRAMVELGNDRYE